MFLSKLTWQAYSRFAARPIAELERFHALDPAAQRRAIGVRLLAQVRYFGTRADALPEWRDATRVAQPEELLNIWPTLPIVTKAMLGTRFEPVAMQRRFHLHGRVNATGGSTGEPTRFFLDTEMLRASRGAHLYSQLRMGWRPGVGTVIVWGSDRDIGRQTSRVRTVTQHLYRHYLIPGFVIDDRSVERIHRIIREQAPVAIYGFSSLLQLVAERTLAMGVRAAPGHVRVAWNGGEMLYPSQVELFKQAFGVPILNRYGGRELSAIAFQESEVGPLRILRPWLMIEIVDDDGKPVPPGETGRLLLTSTICRGTPFLRYDIGDLGSCSAEDRDESGIHSLSLLHGRHAGALRLSDGRVISSLYWNHLLKDYPEVAQFQVRVTRAGGVSLLLLGRGFSEERSRQLQATLRLMLRDQPVGIHWTEQIPRTTQGKLLQVVQE